MGAGFGGERGVLAESVQASLTMVFKTPAITKGLGVTTRIPWPSVAGCPRRPSVGKLAKMVAWRRPCTHTHGPAATLGHCALVRPGVGSTVANDAVGYTLVLVLMLSGLLASGRMRQAPFPRW